MTVRFESQAEPIAGYRLLERLGSGGFGEVWKAEAPGGIFKAIKIIFGDLRNRETDAFRFAEQELKSLKRVKQVRHPYLLALDRYDIVDGRLMIVMELADCNLWDRYRVCVKRGLPGIPRDELLGYMAETAEVLDLMNDQFQLQHLDIKPQNLFLLYNHVKVADFGQVKDLQGMVASVTGGITPVYAAPETFDGFVSRYCDQYSLACVYQELLTGQRPFDGTSMQQLLMQHLQLPPNLAPSPPADRPALLKGLAKRPEDRFPSVAAMVRAIRDGLDVPASVSVPAPPVSATTDPPLGRLSADSLPGIDVTPPPAALVDTSLPLERPAPPDQFGPGALRPTLVIGLGYTGLGVLQKYRQHLAARFGPPDRLSLLRTLYIDTDPDALDAAVGDASPAGLGPDNVYQARLNRAGHYLKPRLNGRTLIEGWFDAQLLYKIPRTPVSMGCRVFGRLAFCDHYRPLTLKLAADLDACLAPGAVAAAVSATGLALRTNRPRVYVVAGLGGGTGSGMFIDLAYAVRARLRRIGYADPEVVGVLLAPPTGETEAQARANTYAALTELHHYTRPETAFVANYDERNAIVRDDAPPFSEVFVVPGLSTTAAATTPLGRPSSGSVGRSGTLRSPSRSGVGLGAPRRPDPAGPDPIAAVADYLRLSTLTAIGRLADGTRPAGAEGVRTFGLTRYGWPRAEVVARSVRLLTPILLNHWVSPDPAQVRQVIPKWAGEQWARLGLDLDKLSARLAESGNAAVGERVEDLLAASAEQLTPKGWLGRVPESDRVKATLTEWQRLLGRPGNQASRQPSGLEEAILAAATDAAEEAVGRLDTLLTGLIEAPLFRLAGTEEAIRQTLVLLDRTRVRAEQQGAECDAEATAAFDQLLTYANYQKGMRKPAAAELGAAVAKFPASQHKVLVLRGVVRVYRRLREQLTALMTAVINFRLRVEGCRAEFLAEVEAPAGPAAPNELLPAGCATTEDAAQVFVRSLTDDDLLDLDGHIQGGLERDLGGLYQTCLNSADGLQGLARVIREEARGYLNGRLGEVDLAAMFFHRHGTPGAVADELRRAHRSAAPALVGGGPWAQAEFGFVAAPAGDGGRPVAELAVQVLPGHPATADSPDELAVYREYPGVPLSAVPQLGPAWAAAYRAAPEAQQVTPHSRLDITKWTDVDQ